MPNTPVKEDPANPATATPAEAGSATCACCGYVPENWWHRWLCVAQNHQCAFPPDPPAWNSIRQAAARTSPKEI